MLTKLKLLNTKKKLSIKTTRRIRYGFKIKINDLLSSIIIDFLKKWWIDKINLNK